MEKVKEERIKTKDDKGGVVRNGERRGGVVDDSEGEMLVVNSVKVRIVKGRMVWEEEMVRKGKVGERKG